MSKIRIHFDGWIALPARVRQALRLEAGDELDVETRDGALVLSPATRRASRPGPGAREDRHKACCEEGRCCRACSRTGRGC